ncbi:NTP pyrophosphohydrolase, DR2231-like [uncultured Caudovirales phage]|uniref:NTP pyrophosphohydrolase, DR2231-like n=1 Tax=uncultured Caudovirales phage TaxID=2100421 RepID=A0A6J5L7I7_9CAUD|nr:NTP pyrophosphohydrolase, DR2231-like [uncultured Caudovirales phage]
MSYLIFKDQKSFMGMFGQRPSPETAALYFKLCVEEFRELAVAWDAHQHDPSATSVRDVAGEAIDLIYVASGLMHALGLDPQPLWDEVQRANVDKIKHPCNDCHGTGIRMVDVMESEKPSETPCLACKGQGHKYEVRRRDDGKVLKPANWSPPALLPLVQTMLAVGEG